MEQKISEEAYKKALQALNLVKADSQNSNENLEKSEKEKLQEELGEVLKKAKELESKISESEKENKKKEEDKHGEDKSKDMSKALEDLSKGFDEKFKNFATVFIKKNEDEVESLKKSISDIIDSNKKLVEFNEKLAQKLNMIESQPEGRKSVSTNAYQERFEKGGEPNNDKLFSLSNKVQRAELATTLFKAAVGDNGIKDNELAKAVEYVELGTLGGTPQEIARMQTRIKKEFGITVVK